MKSISHSQFSAYNECNLKWKLRYIDKLSKFSGSIHTVFGTAMHTTIQAYLTEFYNKSIKSADSMDLPTMLKEEMIKEFTQIREQHKVDVCDQKELTEFYEDGVAIIEGFKKDRAKYFMKKNYELVGIELPIFDQPQEGVQFKSFLDGVIKNKIKDNIKITEDILEKNNLRKSIIVDVSHDNSIIDGKKVYSQQINIAAAKYGVQK